MTAPARWSQAIVSAFLVVVLITTWIAFAPTPVGGLSSYIMIVGNSMEPDFHRGDLVIVHRAPEYYVGEAVAYRNPELKRNVFHRIISNEYDHYTLKGDNNSWVDSYQPSRAEVIGKLWIRIPRAGALIQFLRVPLNMAIFAGVLVGILALGIFAKPRIGKTMKKRSLRESVSELIREQKSRKRTNQTASSSDLQTGSDKSNLLPSLFKPAKDRQSAELLGILEILFFALGLIAFASLILGIISFTRPASITATDDVNYQHIGLFSYSAPAPASVYDSNALQTGEPIFPQLTCSIRMNFLYSLAGDALENISGSYEVQAQILEPGTGWQRTIPLQAITAFKGNTLDIGTNLNLCQVIGLIESMEAETGFRPGQYTFLIIPKIFVSGQIAGRQLNDTYSPQLAFRYDRLNFSVLRLDPEADPFNVSEPNFLREIINKANTLSMFGFELLVWQLRLIAMVGLALSLAGIWMMWIYIQNIARKSPESYARMKYSSMILKVNGQLSDDSRVINVSSIDDLAKLAERHNTFILYDMQNHTHNYMVQTEKLAYLHSSNEPENQLLSESLMQLGRDLRRGFEQGEFQVHYQPIVSLMDGKITAVEALLRWQHPEKGLILAAEFVPAAKTTGLIDELDEWMLEAACTELKGWQESGIDLKLSVNLSNLNVQRNPAHFIRQILETTGVKPHSLQIEIPETDVLENSLTLLPQMQELKDLGINIAMDDFIGQSTIASFSQFPINSIKIDRMIVKKLNNPKEVISVQQMIMVAHNLGLEVAAIGVETDEQRGLLNVQACSQAQGFLLGRPMPAQNIIDLVQEQNKVPASTLPGKQVLSRKAKR